MNITQGSEARYDGLVFNLISKQLAFQNSACTAIALAASDFGGLQAHFVTDEIEQGHPGRLVRLDKFVVEDKSNHLFIVKTPNRNSA